MVGSKTRDLLCCFLYLLLSGKCFVLIEVFIKSTLDIMRFNGHRKCHFLEALDLRYCKSSKNKRVEFRND